MAFVSLPTLRRPAGLIGVGIHPVQVHSHPRPHRRRRNGCSFDSSQIGGRVRNVCTPSGRYSRNSYGGGLYERFEPAAAVARPRTHNRRRYRTLRWAGLVRDACGRAPHDPGAKVPGIVTAARGAGHRRLIETELRRKAA